MKILQPTPLALRMLYAQSKQIIGKTRSTTTGLRLHAQLTESTSNTELHARSTSSIDLQRPHESNS